MPTFARRISRSFRRFPFATASVAATLFGIVLLLPGDTFALGKGFNTLASLAAENTWGSVFAAAGVLKLIALATTPRFAWIAGILVLALFAFLSTTIALSTGRVISTGTTSYAVFAAIEFWAITERPE